MARILGVDIPSEKRIDISLRYIYGIGPVNAKAILEKAGIEGSVRARDLTEAQLSQIVHAIQDGKYVYSFDPDDVFTERLYDNTGQSRWALQVGFRYKF